VLDEKEFLKFIPTGCGLGLQSIVAAYEKFTGNKVEMNELENAITKLLNEGIIFEEQPNKFRRIEIKETEKKEEAKEEKKITFMDLKGKIRFTKLGNVEVRVIIPVNYLRKMFNLPKKEKNSEIITLDGLMKLSRMKIANRPRNWKELVQKYLKHKSDFAKIQKERYEKVRRELKEGVKIAGRLGVKVVLE